MDVPFQGLVSGLAYSPLTVTQLVRRIRTSLENTIPQCWVVGEVSNARRTTSGHLYFTLKDANSSIDVVMFRRVADRLGFSLENGLEVLVFGRVSIYETRGALQFYAEVLEPKGIGALQLALEQLKRKLEKEGLFKAERKRSIPYFPRSIGIVTALSGAVGGAGSAALHDMLKIISSRNPNVRIVISPARVQGEGASHEIAAALDALNEFGQVDVIIVGRGGGSIEDLWPFNEEVVARAIFRSRIPVISAVGHEIDYTIADLVADVRAPTPTAAAQMVVPSKAELEERISALGAGLARAIKKKIADHKKALSELEDRLGQPDVLVRDARQNLDELEQSLIDAMRHRVERCRERAETLAVRLRPPFGLVREARPRLSRALVSLRSALIHSVQRRRLALNSLESCLNTGIQRCVDSFRPQVHELARRIEEDVRYILAEKRLKMAELCSRLDSLSPLRVLERGYAIVRAQKSGKAVVNADQVKPGDILDIRVHQGSLRAKTLSIMRYRRGEQGDRELPTIEKTRRDVVGP